MFGPHWMSCTFTKFSRFQETFCWQSRNRFHHCVWWSSVSLTLDGTRLSCCSDCLDSSVMRWPARWSERGKWYQSSLNVAAAATRRSSCNNLQSIGSSSRSNCSKIWGCEIHNNKMKCIPDVFMFVAINCCSLLWLEQTELIWSYSYG